MARAAAVGKQVSDLLQKYNGISTSKLENRNNSGLTSFASGHKVSDSIHAYGSLDNTRSTLTALGKYAKHELGMKFIKDIDANVLRQWLKSKDITMKTASNILSLIEKVSSDLSLKESDTHTIRLELREELKKKGVTKNLGIQKLKNPNKNLEPDSKALPSNKLEKVVMPSRSQVGYKLQKTYGLRVTAATKINLERQLKGNTLKYQEKGGKWSEREITPELAKQLRDNAVNGKYYIPRTTYERHLKKALEKVGIAKGKGNIQKVSSHCLRHSYVHDQLEKGKTKEEVSQDLGHRRVDAVSPYLR